MSSRLRERRRSARVPTIVGGPALPVEGAPAVQHGAQGRGVGWRAFSAMIVVSLGVVLALFFGADIFYVHSIAVGGLKTMTVQEVYGLTGIANMHIFWVDPAEVRRSLLRSPTIADATVQVGWPPNMVQIIVQEREPALVWEQAGVRTWIDIQGRVMRQRADRDLLRVVSEDSEGPPSPNEAVDVDVVTGALQLKSLYPTIPLLRYNPDKGLGYRDQRGWDAWFGTGTDMPEKVAVYNAIVNTLLAQGKQPVEVNVVNVDAPYFSLVGGGIQ
jgi:hypothetical protein